MLKNGHHPVTALPGHVALHPYPDVVPSMQPAALVEPLRPLIHTALQNLVQEEFSVVVKQLAGNVATTTDFQAELRQAQKTVTVATPAPSVKVCTKCDKPARSKGLCAAHYQAERRRVAAKVASAPKPARSVKKTVKAPAKAAKKVSKKS